MNKKFSALVAAVIAVVLGVMFAVSSFGFVKDGYGESQISALSEIGLIDSRDPESKVTRGEALVAIMIATGLDENVAIYDPALYPCPFTDMSADLEPYIALAYDNKVIADQPYDLFRENDYITLSDMVHMVASAHGHVTDSSNAFSLVEDCKIYKTCEADAFVFELTYATYAEILWNLLGVESLHEEGKTFGELLLERGFMTPEAYAAAKDIMEGYVFGQKHEYVTKALAWFDHIAEESTTESDSETETTAPADTTAPVTSYDTEDNSGYSPPFKP